MGISYLSPRALDGLKAYKYKSAGYTYLDVLHTPLWEWIVNRLPMWLAPNLITLTGLVGVVISFLVDAWYVLDYQGEAPRWVYLLSAVAVIFYVNMDCIDGKQARRTRSSSPLGQLFDHGCDALTVRLLLDNTHCSLDYPCSWTAACIISLVMLPWILAHWEEYHTGSLLYGTAGFGVLEANYTLAIIHLLAYFFGVDLWTIEVNNFLPFELPFILDVRHAWFAAFVIGSLVQIYGQVVRCFAFDSSKLPKEERGNKDLGPSARLLHLSYIFAILVLGVWWTSASPSAPGMAPGLCRLASVAYGLVYALVASQLIVAHMAKEPFTPSSWGYLLLLVGALNRQLGVVDGMVVAAFLTATALFWYGHYVVSVVNAICLHLHIHAFTITVHPSK